RACEEEHQDHKDAVEHERPPRAPLADEPFADLDDEAHAVHCAKLSAIRGPWSSRCCAPVGQPDFNSSATRNPAAARPGHWARRPGRIAPEALAPRASS